MGYCMDLMDADFVIKRENQDKALEAVKKLADTVNENGSGSSYSGGECKSRSYAWVTTEDFVNADDVSEAISAWGWEPQTDEVTGDITTMYFVAEKKGDDEYLLDALAPYVEPGSFIQMQGEDGSIWRWFFDGQQCIEQGGEVTFAPLPLATPTISQTDISNIGNDTIIPEEF